jgi:hypothetical protein
MKITNNLPILKKDEALVVVAGQQNAAMYEIRNGYMKRLDAFKIPRPRYSDNEGHFRIRAQGALVRSGSTREYENEEVIKEFLKEFSRRVKNLTSKFSKIYILAPERTKNKIPTALETAERKKITLVLPGNYYYRKPLEILEKLEEALTKA